MKKLFIFAAFALCACSTHDYKAQRAQIMQMVNSPEMLEYYGEPAVKGFRKGVEEAPDSALDAVQESVLDKYANAQAELEVQRISQ